MKTAVSHSVNTITTPWDRKGWPPVSRSRLGQMSTIGKSLEHMHNVTASSNPIKCRTAKINYCFCIKLSNIMCLVLLANQVSEEYPLVVAANRDEFYDRPSAPLAKWQDEPSIWAGRDLVGGGTWMGVTRTRRFAAVTNYRDPSKILHQPRSRGRLVSDFLESEELPREFLEKRRVEGHLYPGFNLLCGQGGSLFWYSNRTDTVKTVPSGIFGLSNALFDTPWPKVEWGKQKLAQALGSNGRLDVESVFEILGDTRRFPDDQLPTTGVPIEWERALSSVFVETESYGTRSSSLVLFKADGSITFMEQTFDRKDKSGARVCLEIRGCDGAQ